MNALIKHRTPLGGLVLLLFVLANGGFTIVVSTCTMGAHGCVCGMENCAPGCCSFQPDNAGEVTLSSDGDCHATFVIGGLPELPSIIEKTAAEGQARTPSAVAPALSPGLDAPAAPLLTNIFATVSSVRTPSVEKYLLNATFLI